jgi:inorganic pyrophosphatase
MYFPLMVTAVGVLVSFLTTFFATNTRKVTATNIENTIKWQLIISTVLMTISVIPILSVLPPQFSFGEASKDLVCTPWKAFGCVSLGLWTGMIIGFITEYYTSN